MRFEPVKGLAGAIDAPPDKSLTHRAILFAALSDATVRLARTLDSEDTSATLDAVDACGIAVEGLIGGDLAIEGRGLRGLTPPPVIDCANSGTLMRLGAGILVGQPGGRTVLDGDGSLRSRPMLRVAAPLGAMGASVLTAPGGTPPITIVHGAPLTGGRHDLAVASAQVKSAILLAGLFAEGETWVREPHRSRDHTERMLAASGVPVLADGEWVGVRGPVERMCLPDLAIPGDPSSAAFTLVAGALLADPQITIRGVNLNPARVGLVAVLQRMGVPIEVRAAEPVAGEPCGDLVVRRAERLLATDVSPEEVPALIDELPLVALMGVFAAGITRVHGAQELRVKESDRIVAVTSSLRALGGRVDEHPDGFAVHGQGRLRGGEMSSGGDHRLAMLGAIAGLASEEGVVVDGFEAASVSYPGFARDIASLGGVPG